MIADPSFVCTKPILHLLDASCCAGLDLRILLWFIALAASLRVSMCVNACLPSSDVSQKYTTLSAAPYSSGHRQNWEAYCTAGLWSCGWRSMVRATDKLRSINNERLTNKRASKNIERNCLNYDPNQPELSQQPMRGADHETCQI